jgi:hypothetical protein
MAYLIICFFCGLSAGSIGWWKRSSFFIWFLIGAVVPLLGTAAALLWRGDSDESYRECDECGAVLPLYQQVCNKCGADQEWPQELLKQEVRS